jgi:hypothetical protein
MTYSLLGRKVRSARQCGRSDARGAVCGGSGSGANARAAARSLRACIGGLPPSVCGDGSGTGIGLSGWLTVRRPVNDSAPCLFR